MNSRMTLPDAVQTVPEVLAFWAERTPDAPAFIVPDGATIRYADLWRRASGSAATLTGAGFGRRDRVVVLVPEGPDLAVALLGASTAAIALPLPASGSKLELSAALETQPAAAAIVAPSVAAAAREALGRTAMPVFELGPSSVLAASGQHGAARGALRAAPPPRPADIAVAFATSGTTGAPKWVPITHGSLVRDGKSHRDRFGLNPRDRGLALAPLTLSLGLTMLFHGIAAGAALIFPAASDLPGLWTTIVEARPTWMFPSAGWLELLARFLREHPDLPPPSPLRLVRVTAAPISAATCAELADRLGAPVLNGYSSSEAGLIATALPPPAGHKPGSVGLPIQEVRIVDAAGEDAPPGVAGEILVRGPKVFAGYLDDPGANAVAFTADGWFRTGDIGYLDEDGFLHLTGRLTEVINRGGTKISPVEVDTVLRDHPAIREAATFALPDGLLGEDVAAAIVLGDGARTTSRELRSWMLDRLSPHKVPRRIWFVDCLPRTATGKVQRRALAARFAPAALPQADAAGKPSS